MNTILSLDTELFLLINGAHSKFGDQIMWWISNKWTWVPVYACLLIVFLRKYGLRGTLPIVGALILLVVATDQLSASLLKPLTQRLRPCHAPDLIGFVHLVQNKCGGQFGFVSSHAANFFGLATFLAYLFQARHNKWAYMFFPIALIVGYSRVYLGQHYPGDIIGGMILGIGLGLLWTYLFDKMIQRGTFPQHIRQ